MARNDYPKRGSIEGVEVLGEVLLGFLQGMGAFRQTALKVLKEQGICDLEGSRWYPLKPLMLIFERMANEGKIIEGKIGHCIVIPPNRTGRNRAVLINANFYPCEFSFGMAVALARKFKPKNCGHYATVRHDPVECKRKGKDTCRCIMEW